MTPLFAVRNVVRHARRSLLVLANVALGVGGLYAFHGFNAGIMNDYRTKVIRQQMGNGQLTTKGYRDAVLEKPREQWIAEPEAIRARLELLPYVEGIYPRVRFPALISRQHGEQALSGFGEGVEAEREAGFFNALKIRDGKLLTSEADGILLAKGLADSLGAGPGDVVTVLTQNDNGAVNGADLKVTGVFFTGEANFDRSFFRIQLAKARELLETDRAELLAVGLKDFSAWKEFTKAVGEGYPALEAHSFEQIDRVNYENSVVWLDSQFQLMLVIFLTIIVLGVFNTTALGVWERTRESGIALSNGESRAGLRQSFLLEGLMLGVAGSLLGIVITWLVDKVWLSRGILMPPPPGFEGYYYAYLKLEPRSALVWVALGIGGTLLATWFATRSLKSKPITEMLAHV